MRQGLTIPRAAACHAVLAVLLAAALALGAAPGRAEMVERPGWSLIRTPHAYTDLIARVDAAVKANKMGLVTRASATLGAASAPDLSIRTMRACGCGLLSTATCSSPGGSMLPTCSALPVTFWTASRRSTGLPTME